MVTKWASGVGNWWCKRGASPSDTIDMMYLWSNIAIAKFSKSRNRYDQSYRWTMGRYLSSPDTRVTIWVTDSDGSQIYQRQNAICLCCGLSMGMFWRVVLAKLALIKSYKSIRRDGSEISLWNLNVITGLVVEAHTYETLQMYWMPICYLWVYK